MKKHLSHIIIAVAILITGVGLVSTLTAPPAFAEDKKDDKKSKKASDGTDCTGKECITGGAENVDTGSDKEVPEAIQAVTNVLLFLLGAVSVIMIVVGGFKYVVSNGNAEQIKSAKNTIMYAIIGLVVAIFAYAFVKWLVAKL